MGRLRSTESCFTQASTRLSCSGGPWPLRAGGSGSRLFRYPGSCSSLRSGSGLPDSRSCIPVGSKWGLISSRDPEGGHQPQNGRVIPADQEPDVRGRVCNNRGIFPLHIKPNCYPFGSVRGCRPPCNRPCGREPYADGMQPGIFGVLQPRTAVCLTACPVFPGKNIRYLTKVKILFSVVVSSGERPRHLMQWRCRPRQDRGREARQQVLTAGKR